MQASEELDSGQNTDAETAERKLIRCSHELGVILGVVEARHTKRLGPEIRQRLDRAAVKTEEVISHHFSDSASVIPSLKNMRWSSSRATRVEVIENLNGVIHELTELRISYVRWQQSDLKRRISQLQFRLDTQRGSDNSMGNEAGLSPDTVKRVKSVFVIMPFNNDFADVWTGGILKAARLEKFEAIRADMINRSTDITEDIIEAINLCRLAIVDVTGNNPNVMFELGYAIAKKKPQIIISQSADFLPFDIRNIRTIIYNNTWAGIEELASKLSTFFRGSLQPHKRRYRR